MNKFGLVVASTGAAVILPLVQFTFAADVRVPGNNKAPTVMVPSGAMSGMDGSNGFDTILEAQASTPPNARNRQYRVAMAECAAMAIAQQPACRASAQSAYDGTKSALRL